MTRHESVRSRIRPVEPDDIGQISDLFDASYGQKNTKAFEPLQDWFKRLFFHSPWLDDALPSLVYEEKNGRLSAFAGVDVRRMRLKGRPLTAVVAGPLWARLDSSNRAAGFFLLNAVLQGPQDLTIAGGNARVVAAWEFLGGHKNWFSGCRWIRVIRPGRFVSSRIPRSRLLAVIRPVSRPLGMLLDAIAPLLPKYPLRLEQPTSDEEDLRIDEIVKDLPKIAAPDTLRPDYDVPFLTWLLETAKGPQQHGKLMASMVRSKTGKLFGWYVYYLFDDGLGQVIQIVTRPENAGEVMRHLIYHAGRRGATALLGRLEAPIAHVCHCSAYLHLYRYPPLLVQSRDPEILAAARSGDTVLSRLDNEWVHGLLRHPAYGIAHSPRGR